MRALLNGYHRFLKLLLTVLMGALIVPITMQILSRYGEVIPRYIWTEEISRFCFVWIILIGSMIAVRDDAHFDVDLLPRSERPRIRFAQRMFVRFSILVMAFSFMFWGYDFYVLGSRQISEIAGLPMLLIYSAWPIAGVTWALFTIERIADDVRALRRGGFDGAG